MTLIAKIGLIVSFIGSGLYPLGGFAEVYKYVDADGRVTYTNVPVKGAKKIEVDNISTAHGTAKKGTSGATASTSPGNFPKVDGQTQKGRDDIRRKVLEEELATEENLLTEVKREYNDGQPVPVAGETANNPAYLDRLAKLKQTLTLHEKNIAALRQELANLK